MVVKEKRGRYRYVVFSVSPEMRKELLIKRLRSVCSGDPPYIVQCVSGKAVIRCSPKDRDEMIGLMFQADPSSVPLMTSGTLFKVRSKYPELKAKKK
ncbi:MAG: hypothetical protein FWG41_01275 [Methanomassiliicoccaceae archaeon]|nr:hypothetical protein [Methanomassiliicoccaceae archaeon]